MARKPGRSQFQEMFAGSDITTEEWEFLKAMSQFQRDHCRRYPTYREILFVLKGLGYRKVPARPDPPRRADVHADPPTEEPARPPP